MSSTEETFQPPIVPRDSEGFVKSFPITAFDDAESQVARDFFNEYGFVVFSNVFSPEQCQATIDDIWDVTESLIKKNIRHDEDLWTENLWSRTGLYSEGIIGHASLWSRRIILNRQIPALHAAFATILGTQDLIINHDRYGFFRPAADHVERQTQPNLHLDMNPWSYIKDTNNDYQIQVLSNLSYKSDNHWITENNEPGCAAVGELHVQGLVNLADNLDEDGGFWLVPGFHKYLQKWAEKNKNLLPSYGIRSTFNIFWEFDFPELYAMACHISTRAGSVIIWDQRTMHGSKSNTSHRARFAQFVKMFPANHPSMTPERIENRRNGLLKKLESVGIDPVNDLTELGRKVFGL